MKAFRHRTTGQHLPEHGCEVSFWPVGKTGRQWEIFERGKGRRKEPVSKWEAVDLPDLAEGFTLDQFRAYAAAYGFHCAIGFLPTCDYMKPRLGRLMLDPAYPDDETQGWMAATFRLDARHCNVSLLAVFGRYSFDLLAFENHLAAFYGYPKDSDMLSMRDFMRATFGEDSTARFERLFLSAGQSTEAVSA